MALEHHVPARRLTLDYFRRWWFWKGVSKARLERRHPITEMGVDLRTAPTIAGVPRFLYGSAIRDLAAWAGARFSRNEVERTRRGMRLCYFAGYARETRAMERERRRHAPPITGKGVPPGEIRPSLHL
jgi:hypothetical protein